MRSCIHGKARGLPVLCLQPSSLLVLIFRNNSLILTTCWLCLASLMKSSYGANLQRITFRSVFHTFKETEEHWWLLFGELLKEAIHVDVTGQGLER